MGYGDGEWTTVFYGGRRRRLRQQDRGWSGGPNQGKDRAQPAPIRRQGPHQFPNQPVPPFGTQRYFRSQSRSYAAVVRGRSPGNVPRGFPQQFRGPAQARQQPADPKFGKLVRKMHAIIKVVHHLRNVAPKPDKPEPRMISRMVEILASMIKPSSPNTHTMDLIRGNAKNWGFNTLLILEDHYIAALETMLQDLDRELVPDWKPAFTVASRWARRNLPRITQEVLDHAEAHITARMAVGQMTDAQPQPPALQKDSTAGQQLTQTTRDAQQQTSTPSDAQTRRRQTDRTEGDHEVDARSQQVIMEVVSTPQAPGVDAPGSQSSKEDLPQTQRQPRRRVRPCVISEEDDLLDLEIHTEDSPSQRGLAEDIGLNVDRQRRTDRRQLDWSESPVSAHIRDLGSSRQETPTTQDLVQVHNAEDSRQGSSWYDDSYIDTSTSHQQFSRVIQHPTSDRKMIEWSLTVRKKWLILGDSNLARIPRFSVSDLQIDSFPGANFRHAQALMLKATGGGQVEKVILSFGINCRAQRAKETSVKQLQAAVRTAKKQFPQAEIWVPVINYSCSLPLEERQTLQTLNAHIIRNMPYIPALGEFSFQTQNDNVHWTRQTAYKMLKHWARFLNLNAP